MNLLLEIGCEEIPDWMLAGALEHLSSSIGGLVGVTPRTDATPRRLVVRAEGLQERESDSQERIWGPAKNAPEAAVAGFAKKQGVSPADLEIASDGRNEKYSCIRRTKGRATIDILAEALPLLVLKTPFPKTMYWPGKGGPRFIRPIRWIVALLGDRVIPFEIAGVASANESSGHRKLGASRFPVTYDDFEQKLRDNYVILSAAERRKRIRAVPTRYKCDNTLLDTLVNLTEWPTPITGTFDEEFLSLPKEVLITVMRYHQKYFSVESKDGRLLNQFVAVTNTDGDPEGLIRHGNERVLRARFNDARFFWNADQKKKLADRVEDLAGVTFQAKLGTYLDKTNRIVTLVDQLGGDAHAIRAARLAKADLTTELVKEFTELQGIIGGLYAAAQGEPEEVANAICDHYRPLGMEDPIPRSKAGQLLSIADKLDTLKGCFEVGLIPTGSKDPFALRRAAQGIVRIIVESRLNIPLTHNNSGKVGQAVPPIDSNNVRQALSPALSDFLTDRARYYFREIKDFKYDEVNAVLSAGSDNLVDVADRLEAIREVRPTPNFEPVAAAFKRIQNILKQAEGTFTPGHIDEAIVEEGPEKNLYQAFRNATKTGKGSYRTQLEAVARLRPEIDLFFDKVMVNAPDPAIRQNRLTLLHTMLSEFSTIADFSEIVTASQGTN